MLFLAETGNAAVLWFHMCSNAFSVYILNLAAVDFLFLCIQGFLVTWVGTNMGKFLSYVLPLPYLWSSGNSCANTIIYFLTGSFRQPLLQWPSLQLFVQGALQDSPKEDECGDSLSQEALEMSGSRGDGNEDQTDWL
nr:mas-related G-protein coupled receptor member B4-like [Marmota flaviventris]